MNSLMSWAFIFRLTGQPERNSTREKPFLSMLFCSALRTARRAAMMFLKLVSAQRSTYTGASNCEIISHTRIG